MEVGSLAKWVDELASDLQKIRQSVNALAAKPAGKEYEYKETALYTGTTIPSTDIELSEAFTGFDALCFICGFEFGGAVYKAPVYIPVSAAVAAQTGGEFVTVANGSNYAFYFKTGEDATKLTDPYGTGMLYAISGINYAAEKTEAAAAKKTTTRKKK